MPGVQAESSKRSRQQKGTIKKPNDNIKQKTSKKKIKSPTNLQKLQDEIFSFFTEIIFFWRDDISNDNSAPFEPEFRLFPKYSIYFLAIFVFCNRISTAINDENLWMIHPDEVYQSVEVAHSEFYGYGFRPYEYILPQTDGATNMSTSEARYLSLGMYSMRSWLYPRIYQFFFFVNEYFNFTHLPPFYYAKAIHSAFASFLPFSVYKFSNAVYGNSDAAFISAVFVAFSSSFIVLGTHTLIQSFNSPVIFTLMTLILKKSSENQSKSCKIKHYICGIGFGLILSMRVDVIIFYFVMIISFFSYFEKNYNILFGFLTGLSIGGLNDYLNYGYLFISSLNWLNFQIKYAHKLFGSQPFSTYFYFIFSSNHTTLILSIFSTIFIFYQLFTLFFPIFTHSQPKSKLISTFNRLWLAAFYLLFIYSISHHKEIRFIHDALVLLQLSFAGVALLICHYVYDIMPFGEQSPNTRLGMLKLILYGELLIYSAENRIKCPHASDTTSTMQWAYAGLSESGLVNRGLSFISSQKDVSGVVIDYSIHMTGGYTLLHHNVPIIAKTHFEFREWIPEMRVNASTSVHFNTVDRINNFISVYNVQLLLKYVIKKSEYNYFLTTGGRRLPKKGFRLVFNCSDDVNVYKRSKLKSDKEDLLRYGNKLPIGTNSTILEYESSWLITLELYEKAVERLEFSVKLNKKKVRTWQLLQMAYDKLGQISNADNALKRCYDINGKEECLKKQDKVVLHSEYQLNV